ncbi:MAG: hypothetical protein KDJ77_12535 [Rhodobiaceae bacterium]|nr:hypothetical protein [Rhodobiaceae bacterium]
MTKRQISQRMIDTAIEFFLAGERCAPRLEFGVYRSHSVLVPYVCNYAFALEIALKIVATLNKCRIPIGRDGHDLKKICEAIPRHKRKFLAGNKRKINKVANAFVRWRYNYEYDLLIISPDDLRNLFILTHREIQRLDPVLKSSYEQEWGNFEPDPQWAWEIQELKEIGRWDYDRS